ncbi:hypothetical protein PMM47T1_27479 [Pseudomonas sp. M47T1]|nr:hypothetical protein PMM47T1_27479 [Pseudomonas sp. M47T1]
MLVLIESLNVIKPQHFLLDPKCIGTAYHQLVCTENYPLNMVPLGSDRVIPAVNWVFSSVRLGDGLADGISAVDMLSLVKECSTGLDSAIISLALAETIDQPVVSGVASLLSTDNREIVRAVAAIVYIRNEDAASLIGIADIEVVLKSEPFRSLANATLLSTEILPLLLGEAADVVAPFVANLIMHRRFSALSYAWVLKNYSAVITAIEPHGVTQQAFLDWFNGWDSHAAKQASKPQTIDSVLVDGIFTTSEPKFSSFKQAAFKCLDSIEHSEESRKKLIVEASPQVISIARAMAQKSIPLSNAGTVANAIVATLHAYVHEGEAYLLSAQTIAMINTLLQVLDERLGTSLGGGCAHCSIAIRTASAGLLR